MAAPRVPRLQAPGDILISEIHYDNAGTDDGEFVELTAPAGTDLTGLSILATTATLGRPVYDDRRQLASPARSGATSRSGSATVVIDYPTEGLQNGGNEVSPCATRVAS